MSDILLEIRNLQTHFLTREGVVKAVDGLDLTLRRNRTTCVVGESGCGKSITAASVLQLLKKPGRIVGGEILYHRKNGGTVDLARLAPDSREMRAIRGRHIAMIFQEPMSSMSPIHTIGDQITEMILLHRECSWAEAKRRAIELLGKVGIPTPEARFDAYPFLLSGGMRQRAMIAMALSCNPELLIADEPTTALDVTTQANVLDLIAELQAEFGISVMLITHDLGVVAEVADDVTVMYLGKAVETGGVDGIFRAAQHPYTRALLQSVPDPDAPPRARLAQIEGMVPNPLSRPPGCPFQPRCPERRAGLCDREVPSLIPVGSTALARCFQHDLQHAHLWSRGALEAIG